MHEDSVAKVMVISCILSELIQQIVPLEWVTCVDLASRHVAEEQALSGFDLSVNKVNMVHSTYPAVNGSTLTVSIRENKPDTADIDFRGRYITTGNSSAVIYSHATIMSTIIAGGGNSYYTGKGVACESMISSSGFGSLLPDDEASYRRNNITVQNHSYGTAIENFYGIDAMAYDMSTTSNPALLHVFSAGNSETR